jgi:predicted CoA-binding protein
VEQDSVSADIKEVLTRYRTVAIVGASPNPERPSHRVASFLKKEGFHVIPVTPKAGKVIGEKTYPDLASIPVPVEVVDIFRRSEDVLPVVEEAIAIGAKAVWMQEGIVNEEAAARAIKAGLTVVMNHCMRKELLRKLDREKEI